MSKGGRNGIQAIDRLEVKGPAGGRTAVQGWLTEALAEARRGEAVGLAEAAATLRHECAAAEAATQAVARVAAQDREAPLRVADDYLMGLSTTLLALPLIPM